MTTIVRLKLTSPAPVSVECNGQRATKKITSSKASKSRTQARAVKRIFDKGSGNLVGWLYEWNTGEVVPRWQSEAYKDVYYE